MCGEGSCGAPRLTTAIKAETMQVDRPPCLMSCLAQPCFVSEPEHSAAEWAWPKDAMVNFQELDEVVSLDVPAKTSLEAEHFEFKPQGEILFSSPMAAKNDSGCFEDATVDFGAKSFVFAVNFDAPAEAWQESNPSPEAREQHPCPICEERVEHDANEYHTHVSQCFLEKHDSKLAEASQPVDTKALIKSVRSQVKEMDLHKRISLLESLNRLVGACQGSAMPLSSHASEADKSVLQLLYKPVAAKAVDAASPTPAVAPPSPALMTPPTSSPLLARASAVSSTGHSSEARMSDLSVGLKPLSDTESPLEAIYRQNCTTPTLSSAHGRSQNLPPLAKGSASDIATSKRSWRQLDMNPPKRKREAPVVQALPFSPQPPHKVHLRR